MMVEQTLQIRADGTLAFLWDDDLADALRSLGIVHVQRASHVEPNEDGYWMADLSPIGGPVLGPFVQRGAALRAESEWITTNVLGGNCDGVRISRTTDPIR